MGQYSKFPKLQVEDLGTEGTGDRIALTIKLNTMKNRLLYILLLTSVIGYAQSSGGGFTPFKKVKITDKPIENKTRGHILVRDSITGNVDYIKKSDLQGETITLTTAGTSGVATLSAGNLNVPRYDLGSGGELEKITEGGKTGWRLKTNNALYTDLGNISVDFSFGARSLPHGTPGLCSFATGASISQGDFSSSSNLGNTASTLAETVLGTFAKHIIGSATDFVATDPIFRIGIGQFYDSKKDGLVLLKNGLLTAPEVTNILIDNDVTNKAVITKEYLTSKLPVKLFTKYTTINNTTSITDIINETIPANSLTNIGDTIEGYFILSATGTSPKIDYEIKLGGASIGTFNQVGYVLNNADRIDIKMIKTGATTMKVFCSISSADFIDFYYENTSFDFTTAKTLQLTMYNPTANEISFKFGEVILKK